MATCLHSGGSAWCRTWQQNDLKINKQIINRFRECIVLQLWQWLRELGSPSPYSECCPSKPTAETGDVRPVREATGSLTVGSLLSSFQIVRPSSPKEWSLVASSLFTLHSPRTQANKEKRNFESSRLSSFELWPQSWLLGLLLFPVQEGEQYLVSRDEARTLSFHWLLWTTPGRL